MRILVDIRHLGSPKPSGVGEYTKQLLRELFVLDRENAYVLLSSGSKTSEIIARSVVQEMRGSSSRVQHVHIRIPNKLLNLGTLLHRTPTIDQLAGGPFHLLFLPNLNITNIPKHLPTVLTIHDLSWKLFPNFFSKQMQLWHAATKPVDLIARADQILVPSQSTKQDLQQLFSPPQDAVHVIPHGIGSEFAPKPSPQDHGVRSRYKLPKRFALFVGTLEPRKNILTTIDALSRYRSQSGEDLHLVLAGKWGWRSGELRMRIQEPSYRSWIHHLGYVKAGDRPSLFRLAEVFIWPSFYEGFGLPVLEAMASGTPVITSHTSSLPEITNGCAILVDPYNPLDITDALTQLFSSPELQQRLRTNGPKQALRFHWNQAAEKMLNIFTATTHR